MAGENKFVAAPVWAELAATLAVGNPKENPAVVVVVGVPKENPVMQHAGIPVYWLKTVKIGYIKYT